MLPYQEIIELRSIGFSLEKVAFLTGTSVAKVGKITKHAAELGIGWPVPPELSEWELRQLLEPPRAAVRHPIDCMAIFDHVRQKGVAAKPSRRHLDTAWVTYLASAKGADLPPYARATFEDYYRTWLRFHLRRPWMAVNWTPAESVMVDWAGRTIPIYGKDGSTTPAYLFVATLPYSGYTFVRSSLDMGMQSWLEHHRHMFEFIGGVPLFLTPDNLASAVTFDRSKGFSEESRRTINHRYQDMADHYGVIVMPTRVSSPTDKAAVEVSVRHAANRFINILESMRFSSIDQLNFAITRLVGVLNDRKMGDTWCGYSRRQVFLQDEAPHLAPLPETPFTSVTWDKAKASKDAVIRVRGVWYGLPETCSGMEVAVRISDYVIEVYTKDRAQLLARHARREDGSDTFEGFAGRRPDRFKPLDEWANQNGRTTVIEQWHPNKNGSLTPRDIMCRSNKKVWWQCPECGYEWLEPVKNRTRRTWDDCLACANVDLVPGRNDLATLYPNIAAEWHPDRNGCEPSDVFPEHSLPVWWRGAECGHEWLCTPKRRTGSAVGALCPYCSGREALTGFNDVATLAPELAKLWHPLKNRSRTAAETPVCSTRRAYLRQGVFNDTWLESPRSWLANNGYAHVLEPFERAMATAKARDASHPALHTVPDPNDTSKNRLRGARLKWTRGAESFEQWCRRFDREDLLRQWHPDRNENLTPEGVFSGASGEVWWRCDKGHEWQAQIHNRQMGAGECPFCKPSQKVTPGVNDLAARGMGFVKLYSPENPLPPTMVSDRHRGPLLWHCPKCGHEWQLTLNAFPKNRPSCPKCDGWKPSTREFIPGVNDLATKFPYAASFWHPARNGSLTPREAHPFSAKEAWWLCPTCAHEWRESIVSCAQRRNSPCPACAEERATRRHEEAERKAQARAERERRRAEAREQKRTRARRRAARERAAAKRAAGFAAGQTRKLIPGVNDLSTVRPDLARQWHPKKNGRLKPSDVVANSGKKCWWICEHGHEWWSRVSSKNSKNSKCPFCGNHKVLAGFNDLETKNPKLAAEWHPSKNKDLLPSQIMPKSNRNIWWQCPTCGNEWEAVVKDRSKGWHKCCVCHPTHQGRSFRGSLAQTHPNLARQWHPTKNGRLKPTDVTEASVKEAWWRCSLGHEWLAAIHNRTSGGNDCPYCSSRKILPGFNDLVTRRPDLIKQWHPRKNGSLKPSDVMPRSKESVWWLCPECGAEWKTSVFNQSKSGECPECSEMTQWRKSNTKGVLSEERPDLAEQWCWHRNGDLGPETISASSNQPVWWVCKKGHEWEKQVKDRVAGANCPYCQNRKLLTGFNDLEKKNPRLAEQWHPTKNGNLRPSQIMPRDKNEVWWLCPCCGHEWPQAPNGRRTKRGAACPNCGRMP